MLPSSPSVKIYSNLFVQSVIIREEKKKQNCFKNNLLEVLPPAFQHFRELLFEKFSYTGEILVYSARENELEKKGVKRRWRAAESTVESIGEAFHVSGRTTRP